jgi:hypothetical protein
MSWDSAASYLMASNAPASFHGPAPYTPDGPGGTESDADDEYDFYLRDWIRRVERGDFDYLVTEALEETCWTS